jgi:hypothetical protein
LSQQHQQQHYNSSITKAAQSVLKMYFTYVFTLASMVLAAAAAPAPDASQPEVREHVC